MGLHIHSNDNQVLPTSHVLSSISGVKDLIAATIPFQRCFFTFCFSNTKCVFLLIPQQILMVSCLGFLTAKRLALSFRYTRFGIKSLRLNGRGRCYTSGEAQSC